MSNHKLKSNQAYEINDFVDNNFVNVLVWNKKGFCSTKCIVG